MLCELFNWTQFQLIWRTHGGQVRFQTGQICLLGEKKKGTWESWPSKFNYKTLIVPEDLLNREAGLPVSGEKKIALESCKTSVSRQKRSTFRSLFKI